MTVLDPEPTSYVRYVCYLCTLAPRPAREPVTHEVPSSGDLLGIVYACDAHLDAIVAATGKPSKPVQVVT